MKRSYLLCALGLSLLLFSGCAKQTKQMSYIGAEAAKQLALDSAGLTASGVESITTDMSTRNGLDYYQVDFTADGQDYQYDIDALTGAVIDTHTPAGTAVDAPVPDAADQSVQTAPEVQQPVSNSEAGGSNSTPVTSGNSGRSNTASNSGSGKTSAGNSSPAEGGSSNKTSSGSSNAAAGTITADKAKANALAHAGLTSDQVTFVKSKLDYENGRQVYEVEFYTQEDYTEYDYEIDASTGEVISYDTEYRTAYAASGSGTITADEAKEIALAQVPGATADDIRKFETDYDDGRTEYEGKIVYDGMEYEFEIDGYSGAFRSWEAEPVGR